MKERATERYSQAAEMDVTFAEACGAGTRPVLAKEVGWLVGCRFQRPLEEAEIEALQGWPASRDSARYAFVIYIAQG